MATVDVASLEIRVGSTSTEKATSNLDRLQRSGEAAERAIKALEATSAKTETTISKIDKALAEAAKNLGDTDKAGAHSAKTLAEWETIVSQASQSVNALTERLTETARESAQTREATQELTRSFASVAETTQAASQSLLNVAERIEKTGEQFALSSGFALGYGEALKAAESGATQAASGAAQATAKADDLAKSLLDADNATDSFTAALKEAADELQRTQDGANKTETAVREYNKTATSSVSVTNAVVGATRRLVMQFAAAYGAISTFNRMVSQQRAFDVLESTLKTVTGSAEDAKNVYAVVTEFALSTPYDIDQLVEAFVKLKNYGLDPSEKALLSYGNTASAMGKTLEEMVDAVAAASTGNFMALRSWGIRARTELDEVVFSFQGTEHRIKNTARDIEQWLISLGEVEFAGAMEERLGKLDDSILYLEEVYNNLLLAVSQSGIGDFLNEQILTVVDALIELEAQVSSSELPMKLKALAGHWDAFATEAAAGIRYLRDVVFLDGIGAVDEFAKAMLELPLNVKTSIGVVTIEIAAYLDRVKNRVSHMGSMLAYELGQIFGIEVDTEGTRSYEQNLDAIMKARKDALEQLSTEHIEAQLKFKERIAESERLRKEYEKERDARAQATEDRLASYRTEAVASDQLSAREAKRLQQDFDRLLASLRTEEEAIETSYNERMAIILANTSAESALRSDLIARLDKDRNDALRRLARAQGAELEQVRTNLLTQEESIRESYSRRVEIVKNNTEEESSARRLLMQRLDQDLNEQLSRVAETRQAERDYFLDHLLTEEALLTQSYERRKQEILAATVLTEQEKQAAITALHREEEDRRRAQREAELDETLYATSYFFDGLADLNRKRGEEQNAAYHALFAMSKAFSVASTTVAIATGIAKAQELGFPANLAEMARVGALGVKVVNTIKGANYAGAYDDGGRIPAGKIGLVGEYGPEFVQGPAMVTSRKDTRRMIEKATKSNGDAAQPRNIRIVNAFDVSAVGDYIGSDEGEEVILNVIRRNQTAIRNLVGGM